MDTRISSIHEEMEARKQRVNYFKSELSNYRYYQYRLVQLQEELEVVEYDLTGVKGVKYHDILIENGLTQSQMDEAKMNKIQFKGEIERKMYYTRSCIEKIDMVLSIMDSSIRNLIMRVYVLKNSSYDQELDKFEEYSRSGLQREVNDEIYNCIKNLY